MSFPELNRLRSGAELSWGATLVRASKVYGIVLNLFHVKGYLSASLVLLTAPRGAMAERSSSDGLREALTGLSDGTSLLAPGNLTSLQHAVCDVVDDLKVTGMAPEHVILAVKAIAINANIPVARGLVEKMVTWSIQRYFAAPA